MAIDRRTFLALLAGMPFVALPTVIRCDVGSLYISSRRDASGDSMAVIDVHGNVICTEKLPGRGHGTAVVPNGAAVAVFARRPGRFVQVFDMRRYERIGQFTTLPERHFYGHGFFNANGRLLFATENNFEDGHGVLGIYDVDSGYHRVGEFDAYGIGSHEAILMRNGRIAVVANGGIMTHPDYPRHKFNLAAMEPSLVYVDVKTGDLLAKAVLPQALRQLSIRHLAETRDGTIWFGCQYQGSRSDVVELVGWHRSPGRELQFLSAPKSVYRLLNGYVGSIAYNEYANSVAVTSPRGGRLLIWDARSRTLLEDRKIFDVSGIAPTGRQFIATDGSGRVWLGDDRIQAQSSVSWDNHLTAVHSTFPGQGLKIQKTVPSIAS